MYRQKYDFNHISFILFFLYRQEANDAIQEGQKQLELLNRVRVMGNLYPSASSVMLLKEKAPQLEKQMVVVVVVTFLQSTSKALPALPKRHLTEKMIIFKRQKRLHPQRF